MLTCLRTRRRIGAYLDGGLEPAAVASTERHLAACATCQREAETLRRMKNLLQQTLMPAGGHPEPDWTGFWPGVVRGIQDAPRAQETKPRLMWFRPRWALGGALAALLLVSVTLWQWRGSGLPVSDYPVTIRSADTDLPDGSVMIYHTPEKDMTVVWVFGLDD